MTYDQTAVDGPMIDYTDFITRELDGCIDMAMRHRLLAMWSTIAKPFCTSPASSSTRHHHCWPGGLAEHSLDVLIRLRRLVDAMDCPVDSDSVLVVALFHDLGKMGAYERLEVPAGDKLYRASAAAWPNHAQRSLFLLDDYGVPLCLEDYQAILLHDGQYIEANRGWAMREPDLALLLHWADMWSAKHAGPAPRGEG
jgi:hypothetical protein